MKLTIPSGIAAALLLTAGLLWWNATTQPASAAEQLQQAAEATRAYKGWVHMEVAVPPQLVGPHEEVKDLRRATEHWNTADGAHAGVKEFAARRLVELHRPAARESASYDSTTGELTLRTLSDLQATARATVVAPTTVADVLAEFKKQIGKDPASVRRSTEGKLDRYDVTLFATQEELIRFRKEQQSEMPNSLVVWVSPQTKLLERFSFPDAGISVDVTYGEPSIRDIHDLGVPRDAKVVDQRLAQDAKSIINRLDARVRKGLGDYVALVTIGGADAPLGFVTVYAVQGQRWLVNSYHVGQGKRAAHWYAMPEMPQGWPKPDAKDFLSRLRTALPTEYAIGDGPLTYRGWLDAKSPAYPETSHYRGSPEITLEMSSLPGTKIWGRSSGGMFAGMGVRVEVRSDPNRPRLVGLFSRTPSSSPDSGPSEFLRWLDPSRDDMPIERLWKMYAPDGKTVNTETRTEYTAHEKLPSGQWVPTRWIETRINRPPGQPEQKSVTEYNLLFRPDLKLEPEWFTPPKGQAPVREE